MRCIINTFINQTIISLIKQSSFTMDDNGSDNDGMHELDWDDDSDMMAAAVLTVVNNNIATMLWRSFWWS